MWKGSVDEKVVVYGSGSFVMGVVQTRDYCTNNALLSAINAGMYKMLKACLLFRLGILTE